MECLFRYNVHLQYIYFPCSAFFLLQDVFSLRPASFNLHPVSSGRSGPSSVSCDWTMKREAAQGWTHCSAALLSPPISMHLVNTLTSSLCSLFLSHSSPATEGWQKAKTKSGSSICTAYINKKNIKLNARGKKNPCVLYRSPQHCQG